MRTVHSCGIACCNGREITWNIKICLFNIDLESFLSSIQPAISITCLSQVVMDRRCYPRVVVQTTQYPPEAALQLTIVDRLMSREIHVTYQTGPYPLNTTIPESPVLVLYPHTITYSTSSTPTSTFCMKSCQGRSGFFRFHTPPTSSHDPVTTALVRACSFLHSGSIMLLR